MSKMGFLVIWQDVTLVHHGFRHNWLKLKAIISNLLQKASNVKEDDQIKKILRGGHDH